MRANNLKYKDNVKRRGDIISSILNSDKAGMIEAIRESPDCVNDIHKDSGMNAPMLAAAGRQAGFITTMCDLAGPYIDFQHRSGHGHDLMEVALGTLSTETINAVEDAYQRYAAHILNNWPEP